MDKDQKKSIKELNLLEIEVSGAFKCSGTCEACVCQPKGKGEIIKFYASHYADSAKTESFCCLVEKGVAFGSYSRREWFGLKTSSFTKKQDGTPTEIIVSAPLWLLERKGITNLITKV